VVYIEVVPSEYALRLSERPGATVSAFSTALGRSILAFSPAGVVESLVRGRERPALTPFTITDPAKLLRELAKIRTRRVPYRRAASAFHWSTRSARSQG